MQIALVAGELSGDKLGASLITALKHYFPTAQFVGIGGEQMIAAGLYSQVPLEKLSVMGLMEVVRHLPELLTIRRRLVKQWRQQPPAIFIGIDAPDFNLGLANRLRAYGIPTVHYVSPQVWAWRRWRVKKIAQSIDLMLTLFPFEAEFYRRYNIPVCYVGHPLADEIPLQQDRQAARQILQIDDNSQPVVTLLPGSRRIEIQALAPVFIATARWLQRHCPSLCILIPAATPTIHQQLTSLLAQQQALPIKLLQGQARTALTAADAALVTSGTITLEALLVKCPMVVAYKVAPVTAWLARRLVKVPYFALPNLLAEQRLVAEFFQQEAEVEQLGPALLALLNPNNEHQERNCAMLKEFAAIHLQLRCDASAQAALAISDLVKARAC